MKNFTTDRMIIVGGFLAICSSIIIGNMIMAKRVERQQEQMRKEMAAAISQGVRDASKEVLSPERLSPLVTQTAARCLNDGLTTIANAPLGGVQVQIPGSGLVGAVPAGKTQPGIGQTVGAVVDGLAGAAIKVGSEILNQGMKAPEPKTEKKDGKYGSDDWIFESGK
jgi:hypothetical protein